MKKHLKHITYFLIYLSVIQMAFSQDDPESEAAALQKASQNPIASLTTLPIQFNFNMSMGEFDRMQTVINIQPVLPTKISENWSLVNRIIIPVVVQPDLTSNSGSTTGIGTINYTAFFTPNLPGKIAVGFGPSLLIPTNTGSEFGDGQFAVGPSVVLFAMLNKWSLGFVAAQNWAYYSPNAADKHSSFFTQYFINYNLPNAWSIGTAPTLTANWNAEDGEQWTIPFGLSGSKVTKVGNQHMKFALAYYYNAVRPTNGAKGGQIQAMAVFLFPSKPKK